MRSRSALVLAAASACSVLLAGAIPADAAKVCKGPVSAGANLWPTRAVAEATAVTAWQARVTTRDGVMYANWVNASSKTVSCKQTTSLTGANTWGCDLTARPCILQ